MHSEIILLSTISQSLPVCFFYFLATNKSYNLLLRHCKAESNVLLLISILGGKSIDQRYITQVSKDTSCKQRNKNNVLVILAYLFVNDQQELQLYCYIIVKLS